MLVIWNIYGINKFSGFFFQKRAYDYEMKQRINENQMYKKRDRIKEEMERKWKEAGVSKLSNKSQQHKQF